MESLRQDLVYAARSLRRTPGFTTIAILTLAIGIGGLTAIFAVVNTVLWRPLPYGQPERIVQIWSGRDNQAHGPTAPANFLDLRAQSRSFTAIAAEDFGWYNLAPDETGQAERLYAAKVSPSFFAALGVPPQLGRSFRTDEESPDARVAILSNAVWQQRYGRDPRIVGRMITMNDESFLVVGVMPPGFDFPSSLIGNTIDLWLPLAWKPNEVYRGLRELGITARLRDGVTLAQAQQELSTIAARLAADYPRDNAGVRIRLVPLFEEIVGSTGRVLYTLFGAVALVLLIACSNVANLSLARAQQRQRELSVRVALGAGRRRLAQQLLTESVVLALVGGSLGVLIAVWSTSAFVSLGAGGLPRIQEIAVNGPALLFALGVSVVSALLFGAVPALTVRHAHVADSLRAGRMLSASRERRRFRSAVVVAEMAMSLVLLVGAGLLLRSFQRLTSLDPGFRREGVMTATVALRGARYDSAYAQRIFLQRALGELASARGVRQAAAIDYLPFGRSDAYLSITIEGRTVSAPSDEAAAHIRSVTAGYFDALSIPIIAGRAISSSDGPSALPVAVVSDALVRTYWPGAQPAAVIGRRVHMGRDQTTDSPWLTIVGVVASVRHWNLREEAAPELYMSMLQQPASRFTFVMRTDHGAPAQAVTSGIRAALQRVDPRQPVTLRPLSEYVSSTLAQPRFRGTLLGTFAAVALLLAVVGIYGVVSFGVAQRTREIGVRIALGARPREILNMVLREGLVLTAAGLAIGIIASFWLTRLIQGMLFDVGRTDLVTFAGVSVLQIVTATLANYVPARRAAHVDPLIAMQIE